MSRTDEALAAAFAELGVNPNGQHRIGVMLPEDFWGARDAFGHVRQAAHSRLCSAAFTLDVVLARVAAATWHTLELPPIVGGPRPLSYFAAGLAPPGIGKTNSADVGTELLSIRSETVADRLPLGSGEGLAETLFVWEENEKGKRDKVLRRHGAYVYVDEGRVVAELGNRKGATLLPTLNTIWMGGVIGNTNASETTRRIVPAGAYTFGIVVALQPKLAGALLDDADAGTPQRFTWAYASDPAVPDEPPDWPGPLDWERPSSMELAGLAVGGRHRIPVDPGVETELRAGALERVRGAVIPDPLDAHGGLLQLKTAALFALLDRRVAVTAEDWSLAGIHKRYSDMVRDGVLATAERTAAEREAAATERLTNRRLHSDAAAEQRRIIDCSRRIAAKVHEHEWLRRDLFNDLRLWRDVFNDGLDHALAEGWVTENVEPGRGDDKRVLRPGSKKPS